MRKNIKIEIDNLANATRCVAEYFSIKKKLFIQKSFFLWIHKILLAHDDKNAGKYRTARYELDINKKTFEIMPAWKVELEIDNLREFINDKQKWEKQFKKDVLHKIDNKDDLPEEEMKIIFILFVAWYAHHRFVVIHPFVDGNGRMARLLMCLILMMEGMNESSYPVLVNTIINKNKDKYLDTLNKADLGDYISGINYMIEILTKSYKLTSKILKK